MAYLGRFTAEPQRTLRKRRDVFFAKIPPRFLSVLCGSAVNLPR